MRRSMFLIWLPRASSFSSAVDILEFGVGGLDLVLKGGGGGSGGGGGGDGVELGGVGGGGGGLADTILKRIGSVLGRGVTGRLGNLDRLNARLHQVKEPSLATG
jgi:hypothetical protein